MKVLIQGLGEVPATIELALEEEKPDTTHIICSEYQASYVARKAGYKRSNKTVIEKAAKKANAKLVFHICDTFDPKSVSETFGEIVAEIGAGDNIVINYTGGTALVRLLLGAMGIYLSGAFPAKVVYSVRYRKGIKKFADQTEELKGIFKQLQNFL